MGILHKTFFSKCMVFLGITLSSSAIMVINIEPLEFKCYSCNEHNRKHCVGGEVENTPCRPVFGFELQFNTRKSECLPNQDNSNKNCPHCKNTAPQSCENTDISKKDSPVIPYYTNETVRSIFLYTIITFGNMGITEKLYSSCFYFDNITRLKNTPTLRNIYDSCFSLDYNISITCPPNFYGQNCDIECRTSSNATTGFYKCNEDGLKECLTGWTGENCTMVVENNELLSQISSSEEGVSCPNCSTPVYGEESTSTVQYTEIQLSSAYESPFNPTKTTMSIIAGGVVLVIASAVLLNLGLKRGYNVMKMRIEI